MRSSVSGARRTLAAIAALVALAAVPAGALSLISVKQEIEIGRQAEAEIRRDIPELRDHAVSDYVDGLGLELAGYADGPQYPYTFSVANTRDLNAFALPGGPVWIHRGVLDAATSEAQVAGVIAHEIAHISQRHAARRVTKALAAQGALGVLGAMLGYGRAADATRVGAQLVAGGVFLKFSRDDEREADREGVRLLQRAGYDPRGLAEFMDILHQAAQRDPGAVEVFLSTHPSPRERAADLYEATVSSAPGRRDSPDFSRMKARLDSLPPAKALRQ